MIGDFEDALLPGRIGPYRPLRCLGEGGMGVVYEAEDTRAPGSRAAVKVLLDVGESSPELTQRFRREIRILEKLRHPSIVSFLEGGVDGDRRYLAMELLSGRPLTDFVGAPYAALVPLFIRICEGLRYLAERGIVHRDLSLNNILVVEGPRGRQPKILDFGIAKDTLSRSTLHDLTETGAVMGKLDYLAPEQLGALKSGEAIDWRADLYALGVIFYRCLSGRFPFTAGSIVEHVMAHLRRPPDPLGPPTGRPALPPALEDLVLSLLAKAREDRPASYDDVIAALERSIGDTEVLSEDQWMPESAPTIATSPDRSGGTGSEEPTVRDAVPGTDATLAFSEATEPTVIDTKPTAGQALPIAVELTASAPTELAPGSSRGVSRFRRSARSRRVVLAVAAGSLVLAAIALVVFRSREDVARPGSASPAASTTSGPVTQPARAALLGRVTLNAIPWATLVSVTDASSGKAVTPLPEGTTPLSLTLPEGRYRVVLRSANGADSAQTREIEVGVVGDTVAAHTVTFQPPEDFEKLVAPPRASPAGKVRGGLAGSPARQP